MSYPEEPHFISFYYVCPDEIVFIRNFFFVFLRKTVKIVTMEDKMKKFEISENLQKSVMNIMFVMQENYSHYPEYKTIMMNLTTVSKELNLIRIKEITGELEASQGKTKNIAGGD